VNENISVDVAVVGAGFAGLTAARDLAGSGQSVCVLEARSRVGGRVFTTTLDDGTPIDLGGQWTGPTQDAVHALAESCRAETFLTYTKGDNLVQINGRIKRYKGTIPSVGPFSLLNVGWAMWRLDRLAAQVPRDKPWTASRAREWDEQTLATWLNGQVYFKAARDLLDVGLETIFSASPSDISLLHALFYIQSAGNLDRLLAVENGAQQNCFTFGMQSMAEALAGELGGAVRLGSRVRSIEQTAERVMVSGEQFCVTARRAIVAIPPVLAGRIDYTPALPGHRDQLTQRVPMGSVIKCMAVYETPFWREDGLSGQMVSDTGPVRVTFDNSPKTGKPGILLGFIEGHAARQLGRKSEKERREIVVQVLARHYGPRAQKPVAYVEKDWSDDEWSRGGYAGIMGPGVWTSYGSALREPVGRIHWAGTETADVWNGYVEGAIRSGARAAKEVRELPF
jgi:monoamine oxidase